MVRKLKVHRAKRGDSKSYELISTTRRDSHGEKFTPGALQLAARRINGERAIAMGVQHDPTLPPRGKLQHARVVQAKDGTHYDLLAKPLLFPEPTPCGLMLDGEELFRQGSEEDRRPFCVWDQESPNRTVIEVDVQDFDSTTSLNDFRSEVEAEGLADVRRRINKADEAQIASIVIAISQSLTAYLLSKEFVGKVVGKAGDELGEDLLRLYRLLKVASHALWKRLRDSSRRRALCLVLRGSPVVELIAYDMDADGLINAFLRPSIEAALHKAAEVSRLAAAEKIQLVNDGSGWKFTFMLTKAGEVIGRRMTFERRRLTLLQMAASGAVLGGSVGGTASFDSVRRDESN